jgi:hypothetical protein
VRLLAVEGCAALGKLLEPQDCAAHILPVIVNFSQVYSISHVVPIHQDIVILQVICVPNLNMLLEDTFVISSS